jgi:hypothetical protein
MKIEVVTTQIIDLDLDALAKAFSGLDDESQAQFFVKVAAIAAQTYVSPQETQWWYVGRHLRTCECSTEEGRDLIRSIHYAMEFDEAHDKQHGVAHAD